MGMIVGLSLLMNKEFHQGIVCRIIIYVNTYTQFCIYIYKIWMELHLLLLYLNGQLTS